jgi:hypothetical protein
MSTMSSRALARRFARLAVVAAATLTLAGCDLMMTDFSAQATDQWSKTYTLAAGGRIEVVNVNGRIEVQPSAGDQVEVRAEKIGKGATDDAAKRALARITIEEQTGDNTVRLSTKVEGTGGFNMGGTEVKYYVRVPAGVSVKLDTTNGAIVADNLAGDLSAETVNGSIKGRGLAGEVSAATINGAVDIEMSRLADGGVSIETTNGGIDLTLPRDAAATVSARLANGRINTSDLSIETTSEDTRRRLDGTLNGGGPRVRLETTNGGISIRGRS